ncbi:MAG: hypothetical protein L0229_16660 [Blastocatellia bacterium]|nr:hypothetical protein [Blastocatellia bacterium]
MPNPNSKTNLLEKCAHDRSPRTAIPRRKFIRNTAIGLAGATLGLRGTGASVAADKESGVITLDAILITYFTATIGAIGFSTWHPSRLYANTYRLNLVENPDLKLKGRVPGGEENLFIGHAASQTKSTTVSRGVTLRHRGFAGVSYGQGTGGGPAVAGHTQFYGMLRPRISIRGNSRKIQFRFLDAEAEFFFPVDNLTQGAFGISPETSSSWLQHYVTDASALTEPRFKLKASTGLISAGISTDFVVKESGDSDFSEELTAVTSARIIEQTGFASTELAQAFAVGNHIEVTHTSVQEFPANRIIKMETRLERVALGENRIYWDRAFKNFLIVDVNR